MTSKYWIKLYHEMLHDPKMGRMSDHLYRRTIELFLMAGEQGEDGKLPDLEGMAWTLRADPEELETDLVELQRVGILSAIDGTWYVTNFVKRQEPMDKAEYMSRKRVGNKLVKYYQPVTNGNTEPEEIRIDTDKNREEPEEEPEEEPITTTVIEEELPNVINSYQENIGVITHTIAELLKSATEHYPPGWIPDAIDEAVKNNVRKWSYIDAILKNWETNGRNGKGKKKQDNDRTTDTFKEKMKNSKYAHLIEH
jgi:DnaD/phage-associated family protein